MINQVKIRMAVSQLIGASEVEYGGFGGLAEAYEFTYLGKRITIVHFLDNDDDWYIDMFGASEWDIKFYNIDAVVEWIKGLAL